ncbi:acyl-CoA thioesterase [Mycolicibacterium tusciae]|uniref:acyl-CoA thioesterase n=1 Tax=Mycolicibacterium tusciae TaxID=75922 RepID=UPI00024A1AFE|nr:acyl-CoA thioesterase domain-containing protein [Mycolicibacterium tusciae]
MSDLTGPLRGSDTPLEKAVLEALDDLEHALQLEPQGDNRFRATNEPSRFGRVFGGQLLAQAIQAATATVSDHLPQSLHAYFVQSGDSDTPLDIDVERVRDGRSMATRRITVAQDGRTLLTAIASFHTNPVEPDLAQPPVRMPPPEDLPLLQHWVEYTPPEMRQNAATWINVPPPLEMRIAEAPTFLGGAQGAGPRSHWMRLPREIDDHPAVHSAVLAYASDYLLVDMAFRNHPQRVNYGSLAALSLDHCIWFHRPVHFEDWYLYTQEMVAVTGHRAMVRGTIRDADGHVVATTAQEVLVRPIA